MNVRFIIVTPFNKQAVFIHRQTQPNSNDICFVLFNHLQDSILKYKNVKLRKY